MSAKDMFEELGYRITKNDDRDVIYICIENEDLYIEFDKKYKVVDGCPTDDYFCDMPLLKAINQQCKELGWID